MGRIVIQLLAIVGLALTLSACVESTTDPFAGKATLTPLPDKFMAAGDERYVLERDGDHYAFVGDDTFNWVKFFPLDPENPNDIYFIVQIAAKNVSDGYTYTLGQHSATSGTFDLIDAKHGTLAASLGIANPNGDDNNAILEDASQIGPVLAAGLSVDDAETHSYTILDYADPEQRAKAKALTKADTRG